MQITYESKCDNAKVSNDPRKLPLDHIHYSSVEKLITKIDVLRFILKVCDNGFTQNRCIEPAKIGYVKG